MATKSKRKYSKAKNTKLKTTIGTIILIIVTVFFSDKLDIIKVNDILTDLGLREEPVSIAQGNLSVHYIDVGQGDCEFIVSGDKCVLIDSGETENAQKVINYIKSCGFDKIDVVIVTHPHSDHMGSMSKIVDEFEIDKFYMPQVSDELTPTSMVYEKLLTALSDKNMKISKADFGEKIDLGDSILTLYPPQTEYDDLNNYSIVAKLTHGNNSFLFTGDAEKESEKYLIANNADIKCDVLKVGHHGSSSSSTKAFLDVVNPSMCIISCGAGNRYNHPNDSVVERLQGYTDTILRTDILGTIVVTSDGNEIKYSYENR